MHPLNLKTQMIYILYSYGLDGTSLQIIKSSEDFETIAESSRDLGFDISNLTPALNASANIYNGTAGWYVLGVRDSKVYQIDKIDIKVPENKELVALFEKYELAEPTDVGQTHEAGPVCLKESDEEIYRYFQKLLVDDYPIDYQIEACREFAESSSFTTADEVEYRSFKFKVE